MQRLLWRYFTSLSGAIPSINTGLFLPTQVSGINRNYQTLLTSIVQCSAATNHLITNAIFNISSDLIILSIPIPLLFKVRLPKKNKVVISLLFMVGLFTVRSDIHEKMYLSNKYRLLPLSSTNTTRSDTPLGRSGLNGTSESRSPPCFAPICP
jgi:hypothetical protein